MATHPGLLRLAGRRVGGLPCSAMPHRLSPAVRPWAATPRSMASAASGGSSAVTPAGGDPGSTSKVAAVGEPRGDIRWSNPRENLRAVPDEVLYALPPPMVPPFPESEEEASKRFWRSWLPGIATVVFGTLWYTRHKLRREWRGKLESVAPGVVPPLMAVGFIPHIDGVDTFNRRRLFERAAAKLSTTAAPNTPPTALNEQLRSFVEKVGGNVSLLPSLETPLTEDQWIAAALEATAEVRPALLYFFAQERFGVVAVSPQVEDALLDMYQVMDEDMKQPAQWSIDDVQGAADHLGVAISKTDALRFLLSVAAVRERIEAAAAKTTDDGAPQRRRPADFLDSSLVRGGVAVTPEEFLNFASNLLYGVSDEVVLKHVRVFSVLRGF